MFTGQMVRSIGLWGTLGEPEKALDAAIALSLAYPRERPTALAELARYNLDVGEAYRRIRRATDDTDMTLRMIDSVFRSNRELTPEILNEIPQEFFEDTTQPRNAFLRYARAPYSHEFVERLWQSDGISFERQAGVLLENPGLVEEDPLDGFQLGWQSMPEDELVESKWIAADQTAGSSSGMIEMLFPTEGIERIQWSAYRFPAAADSHLLITLPVRVLPKERLNVHAIARVGNKPWARGPSYDEEEAGWQELVVGVSKENLPGIVEVGLVIRGLETPESVLQTRLYIEEIRVEAYEEE
jgi:hypothetical protein